MKHKLDNVLSGLVTGLASTYLLYVIFDKLILQWLTGIGKSHLLISPRSELCVLLIMAIFFRIFIVNLKMINFGRGWLAAVFAIALVYFYFSKDQFLK